jgi:hypothetical protein
MIQGFFGAWMSATRTLSEFLWNSLRTKPGKGGNKSMSPHASGTATVQVRAREVDTLFASPQLQRTVDFDSARWLPSLLSDLRRLETSERDVPGVGDFRVSQPTADHVRQLLTAISGTPLPEPALSLFSGGGVALTCSIGNRELAFTAYPNHDDFVFTRIDDNEEAAEDGILSLDQTDRLRTLIASFLTNPAR